MHHMAGTRLGCPCAWRRGVACVKIHLLCFFRGWWIIRMRDGWSVSLWGALLRLGAARGRGTDTLGRQVGNVSVGQDLVTAVLLVSCVACVLFACAVVALCV